MSAAWGLVNGQVGASFQEMGFKRNKKDPRGYLKPTTRTFIQKLSCNLTQIFLSWGLNAFTNSLFSPLKAVTNPTEVLKRDSSLMLHVKVNLIVMSSTMQPLKIVV